MKLTYKAQITVSVICILLANALGTLFSHWFYRSMGFLLCGWLWILHPVVPVGVEVNHRTLFYARIGGVILAMIGVFTRAYY